MTAATVIVAQMNRYIRKFREAGATSPEASIIPTEHGIRNSFVFQKLVRRGVFVRLGNGRYYLDERKEEVYRRQRLNLVLLLVFLVVVGLMVFYFVGREGR
jgi:hypothetical protein